MITVKVTKEKEYIKEINIKGHANYDNLGKDIVCAAVSSIAITTINAIESLVPNAITYNDSNNLVIKVVKNDETVQKLLINLINELKELTHDYSENIKFL